MVWGVITALASGDKGNRACFIKPQTSNIARIEASGFGG